ncbi:MAG: sugar phosphate isomerase/epimerase family protein [Vicinamibacterales bacterium]
MNPIGIMQGRLSQRQGASAQAFPWLSWREEFAQARECGFTRLEWLVAADRLDENPLWTDEGVREVQRQVATTGVAVTSVCADCFIRRPFIRVPERERQANQAALERLVVRCAQIGIEVVLIPLLEGGAIRDRREGLAVLEGLQRALAIAEASGIQLGLECDLPGLVLRELIDQSGLPALGAYYDVGNAVAAGHDVVADVRALGGVLCGIHLKDRKRDGPSLMLGEGDVNFTEFFNTLAAVGYGGPLILETPAGTDAMASARRNRAFIKAE